VLASLGLRCGALLGLSGGLRIVCGLLTIYLIVLFVRILSSWFPPPRSEPLATVMSVLFALTDPVLRPLRNIMPPMRMGMMALDLSPIIVFVGIAVLRAAIGC